MSHPVTTSLNQYKQTDADNVRIVLKALLKEGCDLRQPGYARSLEIAARLLEQTSASRYKQAVNSLNADQGRYVRRPKEATNAPAR